MTEPEIVLGPPGTGKTTTLLNEVDAELSRGTPPDRIGYVSFTRRAAGEAVSRACERFNLQRSDLPHFRTLHSLCFQALGLSSADVMEGSKLEELGQWLGVSITGRTSWDEGSSFGFELGDRCLHMENLARVRCVPLRQVHAEDSDGINWSVVEKVAVGLDKFKSARGLLDYTDMLQRVADGGWHGRLEVLFVDEAQDLSMLQWRVVARLAEGCRRVVIAGDDDQALYVWAGAALAHFVALPGRVRVLGQSYRVPRAVQGVALRTLDQVRGRRSKEWRPREGGAGEVARAARLDEVDLSIGADVLILARNACFIKDDAIPLLRQDGIMYDWRGHTSARPSVVNAVLTWERLRRGQAVTVDEAAAVYDFMVAGRGYARGHKRLPAWPDREAEVTLADLRERGGLLDDRIWNAALGRIPAQERQYITSVLRRGQKLTANPRVHLSTIHGSKGGEADHVVLVTDVAWRTHKEAEAHPDEEARVWYVAATRAKQRLTIVAPQTRRGRDI